MWHGWGVLIGLTLIAILAWEAAQLADVKISAGPLSPSMLTLLLSALLVLFTLIKVLSNDYVASWAWIGLVLAIVVAVGAWLNMQAAGESLGDLKSSFSPASGSTTAAPAASAAPAAPAAAGRARSAGTAARAAARGRLAARDDTLIRRGSGTRDPDPGSLPPTQDHPKNRRKPADSVLASELDSSSEGGEG